MNRTSFHWLLLALLMQTPAQAEQRLELQGTSIIGSRESPQVLYLVPWQKPGPGQPLGMPSLQSASDLLAPIERAQFRRRLDYFNAVAERP
ncbi:hypothetical protein [Candidatus Endoriftia persephone]|jgi:hypothetical protein|uniref:Uncharacterized protein n=3 Tax=Gammaproteobacteria TaxID=1236 RepID=G2FH96_9GAMM|nr:hypothetical protein [Candidatus Endoriftia persephone]EGV51043.1 hypothetical protein Rifp1Sym_bx00050 [endosymbiont of Riftia pachyptila (vent Ph05)]EGW53770.1 hypothetical protein TevJSym_au00030 [endosymbiont of Tevnia jerichonana (vent Tica)]USF88481.1 hypothetical protein L0Y14_04390 [Candidatus Endoriftia persephone]